MERKQALALAAAITLMLGSGVVAAAAVGGVAVLGFGGDTSRGVGSFTPSVSAAPTTVKPRVITRTRDVYDPLVVDDGSNTAGAPGAPAAGADVRAVAPVVASAAGGAGGTATPRTSPRAASTGGGTSAPPAATPPTTARSLPPGVEIPSDWPPGKPLPPIPPNCGEPHLEDNGIWNCGDD